MNPAAVAARATNAIGIRPSTGPSLQAELAVEPLLELRVERRSPVSILAAYLKRRKLAPADG